VADPDGTVRCPVCRERIAAGDYEADAAEYVAREQQHVCAPPEDRIPGHREELVTTIVIWVDIY
jgi:uncharacterized Zn finger protein (UPF0148 family)